MHWSGANSPHRLVVPQRKQGDLENCWRYNRAGVSDASICADRLSPSARDVFNTLKSSSLSPFRGSRAASKGDCDVRFTSRIRSPSSKTSKSRAASRSNKRIARAISLRELTSVAEARRFRAQPQSLSFRILRWATGARLRLWSSELAEAQGFCRRRDRCTLH